jgi:hypothetical protein
MWWVPVRCRNRRARNSRWATTIPTEETRRANRSEKKGGVLVPPFPFARPVTDGLKERTVGSPGQSENFACGPWTDVVYCLQFRKSRDTILSTRDLSKKRKRRRGRAFETSPETSPCGKIGRANSLIPRLCLVKKVRRRKEHDRTENVARKKIV